MTIAKRFALLAALAAALFVLAAPTTLLNLANQVTGILAAVNGGTGLSSPGTSGNALVSNGSAWISKANPADVEFPMGQPSAGQWFIREGVRNISFPANFTGAYGTCFTNPTTAQTVNIYVGNNGTPLTGATLIGQAFISTGCTVTFATVGGAAQSYNAGQYIAAQAPPIQDPTLNGFYFTLAGTR